MPPAICLWQWVRLLDDAAGVELTDAEHATLRDDLTRADDLREFLRD